MLSVLIILLFLSGIVLGDRWPLSDYPMFAHYRSDEPAVYRVAVVRADGTWEWWRPPFAKEKKFFHGVLSRRLGRGDDAQMIHEMLRHDVFERSASIDPQAWDGVARIRLVRRDLAGPAIRDTIVDDIVLSDLLALGAASTGSLTDAYHELITCGRSPS